MAFDGANNPFDTYYFEDSDPTPKHIKKYQTDGLFDLTMNCLKNRKNIEKPFFCILSVEPPHFSLDAPEKFKNKWKGKKIKLPPNFLFQDKFPAPGRKITEKERDKAIEKRIIYYSMIENLDWNVGRMVKFLKEINLEEDTIIVFFSDHGQMDGAHSVSSTIKDHPYEESIGIPLIINNPKIFNNKGMVIDDPVCTEDLFPTLLGLAGLKSKEPKPGLDITSLIQGIIDTLPRKGVLLEFVHDLRKEGTYHEVYWRGFRTKRYKYTVKGNVKEGGNPWQFYDIKNDPYEMNNLINDLNYQNQIVSHHRMMYKRMIETRDHYVLAPSYGIDGLNLWDVTK
jgi:arylsulfatase A-like enzyme